MKVIDGFIKNESSAAIILIIVTLIALTLENSPLSIHYNEFLHIPVEIKFASLHIAKPLLLWINDGLMAIFFMLIGLEVKREVIEGELSSFSQVILPLIAAIGGMVVPALFYVAFNYGDEFAMKGWAIPTATDIAFALGILSLLGKRVPASLKIFLMALAIIDDLGAILIIAFFYTTDLSIASIVIAGVSLSGLILMNIFKVSKQSLYIFVGVVLWVSVLKSGVHATLAGVALAFCIPMVSRTKEGIKFSMAKNIEHGLHYWVAFLILPLFAFVNAGINLSEISITQMFGGVPMGILFGLFIGKQVGVFGFSWLAIKLKIATLPSGSNMKQLYGVSVLTGIGFTMSLFVDSLAFTDASLYQYADKMAIIVASVLSGVIGYVLLRKAA